ncbi:hypothetical protein LXL04_022631 [Taraxacum kok-saghyz]
MKMQDFHKTNSYELTNHCVDTFKTHAISEETEFNSESKAKSEIFSQFITSSGRLCSSVWLQWQHGIIIELARRKLVGPNMEIEFVHPYYISELGFHKIYLGMEIKDNNAIALCPSMRTRTGQRQLKRK